MFRLNIDHLQWKVKITINLKLVVRNYSQVAKTLVG